MTMFDQRLHKEMSNLGEEWMSPERTFRNHVLISACNAGGIAISAKVNSRTKEVLVMTETEYEQAIRKPSAACRSGSSAASRFFAWHLLGEKNLQQTFFNTVKELQNA